MSTMNEARTESVEAPHNVEEVELLVKRLYGPGSPAVIAQIDSRLKQLQVSADGWQMADALLQSQDPNVRFFGALTFQVKLNNDGSRLENEQAQTVLGRLLSWAIQLDKAGEGHLVRKKLCAALATFFLRSPTHWRCPLVHLAASFQRGEAVPSDQISDYKDPLPSLLQTLTEGQVVMILWLSGTLATDVSKVDTTSPSHVAIHAQMEITVQGANSIIQHVLNRPDSPNLSEIKAECLSCFLNWVNYAQPMWPSKPECLEYLRQPINGLAALLIDPTLQSEAMEVFRDILEGYTTFFQRSHMQLLANIIYEHTRPLLMEGLQNADPEVLPIAQFVIAYGIANIQLVVETTNDEIGSNAIVQMHLAILSSPGYPGDEDESSIQSIEFWNTYIEYINDVTFSHTATDGPLRWLDQSRAICTKLASLLWAKMRTPSSQVAERWSDAESEAFREFRMDASDLLLSIYLFLGKDLAQLFVRQAMDSLATRSWRDVEAALFAINTLGDNIAEDPDAEQSLEELFGSSLFRDIADFEQSIPAQARRTAIDTLGAYGQYVERHIEFLPDTLRFLFASLENPGLSTAAAKSISALCSTCRHSLTGELDGFLTQYGRFVASNVIDSYSNERVINAIAAIIQAVSPESAKVRPLSALLDRVDGMVSSAGQLAQAGHLEGSYDLGVMALKGLASIGKGMQGPDEVAIDLYDDDQKSPALPNFWQNPEGQAVQSRIIDICYTVLQMFPNSGEAVEASCDVLKSGFTETEPGPFVFAPETSIVFLEKCGLDTPRLEMVLSTVCVLITQYGRQDSPRINAEVYRAYQKVAFFIRALKQPNQDPHIAQSCIDVLSKMIPRYLSVLLDTASATGDMVAPVFDFAIKAIDGADIMPKRTAADFWTRLIRSAAATGEEVVRVRLEQAITAYGPLLCRALVRQITGQGQRSELDQLCEPLKALIQKQPQTKAWIEAALFSPDLPPVHSSVDDAEKRKFMQILFTARGDSRRTRDMVKNFYAACRGTVQSFG